MLWLVIFKLWEKATSGPRATVSAVIQNSGTLMPRALLARAHFSAVRETVSAFYRTMTPITWFIECKENVAVARGSLICFTSVVTRYFDIIKAIVNPETKLLSLLTHPHVVPNPQYLICLAAVSFAVVQLTVVGEIWSHFSRIRFWICVRAKYFPTQISVTWIHCVDQQKAVWFESDLCVAVGVFHIPTIDKSPFSL